MPLAIQLTRNTHKSNAVFTPPHPRRESSGSCLPACWSPIRCVLTLCGSMYVVCLCAVVPNRTSLYDTNEGLVPLAHSVPFRWVSRLFVACGLQARVAVCAHAPAELGLPSESVLSTMLDTVSKPSCAEPVFLVRLQVHQMISHLGSTHLAMEPIIIACFRCVQADQCCLPLIARVAIPLRLWFSGCPSLHPRRQLAKEHPVLELLKPHFHDTLAINDLGRRKPPALSFILRPGVLKYPRHLRRNAAARDGFGL